MSGRSYYCIVAFGFPTASNITRPSICTYSNLDRQMNCNTVEAEEYKGYMVWYKYYKRSNAGYVAWGGN